MGRIPARTLTAGHGGRSPFRATLITGYLLRLVRESVPGRFSQERLAQVMEVSPDTVAGWETGRRPLASVRTARFSRLRSEAAHLGGDPRLVRLLVIAMDADQVLDHARAVAVGHEPGDFHPLGTHVHRREVIELAAWPLTGRTPAGLPGPAGRHGPAPSMPEISAGERAAVFDHLRRVAETSGEDSLLRRQALYLQSYDRREDAAPWMADQYRREPRRQSGWTPSWPVIRTLAAAMVRYGDPAALLDFTEYGLADEPGQVANLNYWAYWVGETPAVERDDSFMPARLGPWRGDGILQHSQPATKARTA